MATNLIRKRFDLPTVTVANSIVKDDFELDKGTTRIVGILLTADQDNQLFHRGTVAVQINSEEVIPEDYQAKLLLSGLGVAPKDRYLPIDVAPGNGIVKVWYSDADNPLQAFAAYNVSVYLELEMDTDAIGQ